jgi:hypothetical protein
MPDHPIDGTNLPSLSELVERICSPSPISAKVFGYTPRIVVGCTHPRATFLTDDLWRCGDCEAEFHQ